MAKIGLHPCFSQGMQDYMDVLEAIQQGDEREWNEIASILDSFPHGVDAYMGMPWVLHIIATGSVPALAWAIGRGVDLNFVVAGYSPIHACLEEHKPMGQAMLSLLLDAGADLNLRGMNGWTPLHMAAARNDLDAIKILLDRGADPTLTTLVDDDLDAAAEAELLNHPDAARLIRAHCRRSA